MKENCTLKTYFMSSHCREFILSCVLNGVSGISNGLRMSGLMYASQIPFMHIFLAICATILMPDEKLSTVWGHVKYSDLRKVLNTTRPRPYCADHNISNECYGELQIPGCSRHAFDIKFTVMQAWRLFSEHPLAFGNKKLITLLAVMSHAMLGESIIYRISETVVLLRRHFQWRLLHFSVLSNAL